MTWRLFWLCSGLGETVSGRCRACALWAQRPSPSEVLHTEVRKWGSRATGAMNLQYGCEKPHMQRESGGVKITAGFLYRAGAETPLNFWEELRVSPRTILRTFSAVDNQTAVLVSTAEVWISAPDTQTPSFVGFLGIHSWLWNFCRETKLFGYCPEVPITRIRVSAPAPYKNPTVIRDSVFGGVWAEFRSMRNTTLPLVSLVEALMAKNAKVHAPKEASAQR